MSHIKVFDLTKEMCSNNRAIGKLITKTKGIKEAIKAHQERNATIMDELKVYTDEADNIDTDTV